VTPVEAKALDVDTPVHVVCTCGKACCPAPPPAGCDGTAYDMHNVPKGKIYVDLLSDDRHVNHDDDCSCVFLFKAKDISLRVAKSKRKRA
jgi:hypothetical protein